jgi:PPOX class probable F420-dependent enzyme
MATLHDQPVRELLSQPNYAVVSTLNADGSTHSTVVWVAAEGDDAVSVNSAIGRVWPTNLQRDPRVNVLVFESGNPYHFVEIRGTATATEEGADEHINALTKKYIDQDEYPFRAPGEQRIKFVITPEHVRHVKQN